MKVHLPENIDQPCKFCGKKIKEITVKGLEPEIQRLIAKHKAEVQKIKVLHEVKSVLYRVVHITVTMKMLAI